MRFDLQVHQLLADLWMARMRGGACGALGMPSLLPLPEGPHTHLQPLLLTQL